MPKKHLRFHLLHMHHIFSSTQRRYIINTLRTVLKFSWCSSKNDERKPKNVEKKKSNHHIPCRMCIAMEGKKSNRITVEETNKNTKTALKHHVYSRRILPNPSKTNAHTHRHTHTHTHACYCFIHRAAHIHLFAKNLENTKQRGNALSTCRSYGNNIPAYTTLILLLMLYM